MTKLSSLSDVIKANRKLLSLSFVCVVGACAGQDPTVASDQGNPAAYKQGAESDVEDDDSADYVQPDPNRTDTYTLESDLSPEQLDEALIAITSDSNSSDVISEDVRFTTEQCAMLADLLNGTFHDQAADAVSDYVDGMRFNGSAGRSLELKRTRSFNVSGNCDAYIDLATVFHRPHLSDPKGHLALRGTLYPAMRNDKKVLCYGDLRMAHSDFGAVAEGLAEQAAAGMLNKMDAFCFDLPEMVLQWEALVTPIDWTSGL